MSGNIGALQSSSSFLIADRPSGFSLESFEKSLASANEVWVVTAFAHQTGWKIIRPALLASKASITLISGLDFCQTEPSVLRDWIGGDFSTKRSKAFLYLGPPTFHPKVFLILGPQKNYALIGSGNLSAGGLGKNVECFTYVRKVSAVKEIRNWLIALASDKEYCFPIELDRIDTYEKKYDEAANARKALNKLTQGAAKELKIKGRAAMKGWDSAVKAAKAYSKTEKFDTWYVGHRAAAKQILKLLHFPKFDFSPSEWVQLYEIENMGAMVHIHKYRMVSKKAKLIKALKYLADTSMSIEDRIDMADNVNVWGLGINGMSKILAASEPKKWPVLNSVTENAVRALGYQNPYGATRGQKYAAFAKTMSKFVADAELPDMLALDCFLYSLKESSK